MQWLLIGLGIIALMIVMKKWTDTIRSKAYEEAQEESSMEKLRFLRRLDHELKNPLTAIQVALANLDTSADSGKSQEILAGMRSQVLRVSRLIGDLRKLAALEQGSLEKIPLDLGELLTESAMIFREEQADNDSPQFIIDFDPESLPTVVGDRDLLQLAIYNIIDNARKFTRKDYSITLKAYMHGNACIIEVSDTGRGIPDEDIPHVWEDLYRSVDVQGIPGSGVGLAMVKGIIEQHNGSVDISSVYGSGTTVTLSLPIE